MKRINNGFTLMELLIVIGVLGILAAGLLAAIDPFEQLKKARDTNNRSAAIEMLQSSQRYYATHGYLPWNKKTGNALTCSIDFDEIRKSESAYPHAAVIMAPTGSSDLIQGVVDCVNNTLGPDGEIKSTFFQGLKTSLYIQSGSATRAAVCFSPEAKSNRSDEQTSYKYDATAKTVVASCPDVDRAAGLCLQCFE